MLKNRVLFPLAMSFCIYSEASFSADSSIISFDPGLYSIRTEIAMPHLEESLRYATTHRQQCLNRQQAFSMFPILNQNSFVGCALVEKKDETTQGEFHLVCANPTAATGIARFVVGKEAFRATLKVKMGGKNMKFSQRVHGHRMGACD